MTAIMAIWTPKEVVVSVDSKATDGAGNEKSSVCKILQIGNTYFTLHNLVLHPPTNLDVLKVAEQACQESGTLLNKVRKFEKQIEEKIIRTVTYIRIHEPKLYEECALENSAAFGIVFWGIELDKPAMHIRQFFVSPQGTCRITPTDCIIGGTPPGAYFVPTELQNIFMVKKPNYTQGDLVQNSREFVTLAIAHQSDKVGPPIKTIRVTPNAVAWMK